MTGYNVSGGDFTSSITGSRSDMIVQSINHFDWFTPVFGQFFSAKERFFLGTPHNQYFEWLMRGGFVFLALNLYIFIRTYKYSNKLDNSRKLKMIFLLLFFVSFNLRTAMRVPYSSIFIWILIGMISNKYTLLRNEK